MSVNRIKIEIPFAGFYESVHDSEIDYAFESDLESYGVQVGDLWDTIMDADVDWKAIRQEYASRFAVVFGKEFDLDIKFDEMTSPMFYNFESDRIFATIPADQINKIRKEVESSSRWRETVKDRFTSYDGFASFYSNSIDDEVWTRPVLDECQYLVILQAWLDYKHQDDPNNHHEWIEIESSLIGEANVWGMDSFFEATNKVADKIKNGVTV